MQEVGSACFYLEQADDLGSARVRKRSMWSAHCIQPTSGSSFLCFNRIYKKKVWGEERRNNPSGSTGRGGGEGDPPDVKEEVVVEKPVEETLQV